MLESHLLLTDTDGLVVLIGISFLDVASHTGFTVSRAVHGFVLNARGARGVTLCATMLRYFTM